MHDGWMYSHIEIASSENLRGYTLIFHCITGNTFLQGGRAAGSGE